MSREAPQTNSDTGRIDALEGLRGIAILLILVHHSWLSASLAGLMVAQSAVDEVSFNVFDAAWVGVDLFFVLSGFLITRILLDAKGGKHYFRSFYARRVLRIIPAYYVVLILLLFVLPGLFGTDRSSAMHSIFVVCRSGTGSILRTG